MRRRVSIMILSLTLSLLLFTSLAYGGPSDVLQVSFIDAGQGDSIWLHASDNTNILIDGGRRSAGPTVVAHLRVCTNEYHPEWCGFSYGSGSAIWNNSGDCADLRDSYGDTVDMYCY